MLSPILAVEGMTITLLAGRIADVPVQKVVNVFLFCL